VRKKENQNMTTYQKLLDIQKQKGAGYLVLIDPDKKSQAELTGFAGECESGGADALLVGGSLLFSAHFDALIRSLKEAVAIPVILFPGNGGQLSQHADAVLFMSLVSGRNPHFLIGEQVQYAPVIRALGLEPISMGYMLIESGSVTSAEFMSHTKPIPREKPEIAAAHALAAQYLGMTLVYLEAGSGAKQSVPDDLIRAVRKTVTVPVIVGGGIRAPEEAAAKVKAGASFIVTGNVLENGASPGLIKAFAEAVHSPRKSDS
jgi:putative glycerol-1-phosphate prenyltransferase